jgi:hypothetical protein
MATDLQQPSLKFENNEISLKAVILKILFWLRYLCSKWLLILGFVILGGMAGFCYAYFSKPVFTASSTFVLEEANPASRLGGLGGLASMVGIDLGGGGGGLFQGDNIIELYRSRSMLKKTLLTRVPSNGKSVLLIDEYIRFNKLREKWEDNPRLKNIHFNVATGKPLSRLQDSVLRKVIQKINKDNLAIFKPDKRLGIISVEVRAEDEFFAKAFDDQIVKNVNNFYIQTKTKRSLQNVQLLQQKTDSVRSVINGAIYSAAAASEATPNLNPTRLTQRDVPVQRSQFSAESNKAFLVELVKNLELSRISLQKETPLIQLIDEPEFPLDVQKPSEIRGMLIGCFLAGAIIVVFLVVRKFFKVVMS